MAAFQEAGADPAAAHEPNSWVRAVQSQDIDAHARAQGGWALAYEQLSSGQFDGGFVIVQLPGLRLFNESTNVVLRQQGRLGDDVYGFAMSLTPVEEVYFHGRKVPRHAVMCGRGNDIDLVTPAGHQLIALVVERSLLTPLWERMYQKPLALWLEKQLVLQASAEAAAALRLNHQQMLRQALSLKALPDMPAPMLQMRDDVLIEWIEALPPSVDLSDLQTHERRKRMVDRACELALAHPDEPLSILQVCSRVGASRRKLNYCFQDVLGTSPTKYFRALRLNGVRRALSQPDARTT
ncbi:MAG TPA: helix-turn-helix domain-containing protein, partial [Hydrogenophaga sp.]|nr:helix-turn-helix domain-containing protein [Hydrogenophaga sp.]